MSEPTTQEQKSAQKIVDDHFAFTDGLYSAEGAVRLRKTIAAVLAEQRNALLPFVREWDDAPLYNRDGIPDGGVTCPECEGGGQINKDGKPSKRYPPTHKPRCALAAAIQGTIEVTSG